LRPRRKSERRFDRELVEGLHDLQRSAPKGAALGRKANMNPGAQGHSFESLHVRKHLGYEPLSRSFRSFTLWGEETALTRIGARNTYLL
jgi:hypothetical protein